MKKQLSTTNAPVAIGPYSQGVDVNGHVFVSGQLPVDPKTGETAEGGIKGQTLQIFKNIEAILKEADMTLDNVVKTTVFLANMADFADMNEVYAKQFSGTFPARSAFAVKALPKNADIEIEVVAMR